MSVMKILFAVFCGVVAYYFRDSGGLAVWFFAGIAATFFFDVVLKAILDSLKSTSANTSPLGQASLKFMASGIVLGCSACIAYYSIRGLVVTFAQDCQHETSYATMATLVIIANGAVFFPAPAGAVSAYLFVSNFFTIVDRSAGSRPAYALLCACAGLGAFALLGYWIYSGFVEGRADLTAMHIDPDGPCLAS